MFKDVEIALVGRLRKSKGIFIHSKFYLKHTLFKSSMLDRNGDEILEMGKV